MRAALAVRPDRGSGAAVKVAAAVAERLRAHTGQLEICTGEPPDGLDLLVALGGDGAVHRAIQHCAGTETTLGVVAAGNGNDFARALGLPLDPLASLEALLANLRAGRRRRIDLGRAGQRWFGTVLCAGFDAAVARRAAALRVPRGPRRYDVAVVAELARFRPRPVTLRTGQDEFEVDATLVAIGNTPFYGGGVPICPRARPDDGLFDVTVVGAAGRLELLKMLPKLRTGAHLDHPAVRTLRAREIRLGGAEIPVSADGEVLGPPPELARCVPGALTVLA
ncbi:diacylglycerol/lipid kinase family protein [Amycolatopsis pithecellobii]|uniref:diacylglycerol/lipid kinase family protein n=1 Tax=Amycolatopsis pithecellobii TaxID=664692 RepID=UPI0028AB019F|nr:diacylglycerol kinase family protein [Amycolatopsis pithecellobii]